MSVNITKSDGETEPFDIRKLVRSLLHAGATEIAAEAIARDVEKELWNGISTQEIYARAFKRLREHKKGVAARYSLKRSVMEFGPSGFPFEAYLSELFRAEGFKTEIDQIVQGACVEHEVDVVIHKPGEITYAEAKFHNTGASRPISKPCSMFPRASWTFARCTKTQPSARNASPFRASSSPTPSSPTRRFSIASVKAWNSWGGITRAARRSTSG